MFLHIKRDSGQSCEHVYSECLGFRIILIQISTNSEVSTWLFSIRVKAGTGISHLSVAMIFFNIKRLWNSTENLIMIRAEECVNPVWLYNYNFLLYLSNFIPVMFYSGVPGWPQQAEGAGSVWRGLLSGRLQRQDGATRGSFHRTGMALTPESTVLAWFTNCFNYTVAGMRFLPP